MSDELDFRALSIEEAWAYFKTEVEMNDPAYREARFGVQIHFDINLYFMGYVNIKGKTGKVTVLGKIHSTEDFFTELELRERLMKHWLLENCTSPEIASAWADKGMVDKKDGNN